MVSSESTTTTRKTKTWPKQNSIQSNKYNKAIWETGENRGEKRDRNQQSFPWSPKLQRSQQQKFVKQIKKKGLELRKMRWKFMQLPPEEKDKSKSKGKSLKGRPAIVASVGVVGTACKRRHLYVFFLYFYFFSYLFLYLFLCFSLFCKYAWARCWQTLKDIGPTDWMTEWLTWLTDGNAGWMNEPVTDLRPRPEHRPQTLCWFWFKLNFMMKHPTQKA